MSSDITTWADGYGTWHALVPLRTRKYEANIVLEAWYAINQEIEVRMAPHEAIAYDGVDVERAPEYDTETHIAYKETGA